MSTSQNSLLQCLAESGAMPLYEYVSALVQRASDAKLSEVEQSLLHLRDKVIDRAHVFDGAWQSWSDYWNEAFICGHNISLNFECLGK